LALKQFYIKNVGPAKIQRVQQKIPGAGPTVFLLIDAPGANAFLK
jgi:hypothetical protein